MTENTAIRGTKGETPYAILAAVTVHRGKAGITVAPHAEAVFAEPSCSRTGSVVLTENTAIRGTNGETPYAVLAAVTVHRGKAGSTVAPHAEVFFTSASYADASVIIRAEDAAGVGDIGKPEHTVADGLTGFGRGHSGTIISSENPVLVRIARSCFCHDTLPPEVV